MFVKTSQNLSFRILVGKIKAGVNPYYHFHKIAGWILIPIGLAAVYSQFK